MSTKPTILIVPGAWHSPDAMAPMTSQLEAAGYTVRGVTLPSVGCDPITDDFQPDVDAIRSAIETAADAEEDVLVFMHSYGSVPAGEAVKDLDKLTRRKDGKRGGVSHLFYCAAFALPKKTSLMDALGGNPLPWFDVSSDSRIVNAQNPDKVFYADVPEDLVKSSITNLSPHSYGTMASKTTWEPYRTIPSTYLYCEQDQALPVGLQRNMIEEMKGVKWETDTVDASHSPFLSKPQETARAVRKAAGEVV